MSSVYFLKCLGFDDIHEKIDTKLKPRHKLVTKYLQEYDNCYWDDFSCDMARLTGLKMCGTNNTAVNNSAFGLLNWNDKKIDDKAAMSSILECVKSLIQLRMAVSIDLLILCCIYSNYMNNISFFQTLSSTIIDCLDGQDENFKTRNYQWFKHYILNSNLWLVQVPNHILCKDEIKTTDISDEKI